MQISLVWLRGWKKYYAQGRDCRPETDSKQTAKLKTAKEQIIRIPDPHKIDLKVYHTADLSRKPSKQLERPLKYGKAQIIPINHTHKPGLR